MCDALFWHTEHAWTTRMEINRCCVVCWIHCADGKCGSMRVLCNCARTPHTYDLVLPASREMCIVRILVCVQLHSTVICRRCFLVLIIVITCVLHSYAMNYAWINVRSKWWLTSKRACTTKWVKRGKTLPSFWKTETKKQPKCLIGSFVFGCCRCRGCRSGDPWISYSPSRLRSVQFTMLFRYWKYWLNGTGQRKCGLNLATIARCVRFREATRMNRNSLRSFTIHGCWLNERAWRMTSGRVI